MSRSSPTTSAPVIPDSNHRETTVDFVRWALAQLALEVVESGGVARLQLPETDRASFGGAAQLQLPLPATAAEESPRATDPLGEVEAIGADSRFGRWLMERLHALGPAVPSRPAGQPVAVNDIAKRLFAAYRVDGGRVHLGGCQLTDYPFLRLSFVIQTQARAPQPTADKEGGRNRRALKQSSPAENGSDEIGPQENSPAEDEQEEIRHVFVAHDGSSVSDQLVDDLGLLAVEPIVKRPPRIDDGALQALITAGRRVAAQTATSRDPHATSIEPAVVALVWVKHASGKLHFTIGETTVTLPFSGWARLLKAQPYTSPQSGASSFHLAATDDGRIDTFDQIATCEQSGQRVLRQELVTCSVTGKHVLEEFTETCPVSGKPCLSEEFATCRVCQQRVSKRVLDEPGACTACRQLASIKNDDPRLVWILGEHTGLDRWKHWQLAETKSVYIAQASRWTKRLLVVVDKETLAVHHLATAGKFTPNWSPVAESARAELLGQRGT